MKMMNMTVGIVVMTNQKITSNADPLFYLKYLDVRVGSPDIEEGYNQVRDHQHCSLLCTTSCLCSGAEHDSPRLPTEGPHVLRPHHGGHRVHQGPAEGHQERTSHRPDADHAQVL